MKILFDYQAFSMQTHGGVSRCFVENIAHFPSQIESEIAIVESNNLYLYEYDLTKKIRPLSISRETFLGGVNGICKETLYNALNYIPFLATPKKVNKKCAIEKLKENSFDIFHPTFYDDYFLPYLKRPFVLTVHDLTCERHPEISKKNDIQVKGRRKLLGKAEHVVAVSNHTKVDLIDIYGVDPSKISVIYHGGPEITLPLAGEKALFDFPYFLYVGARNVGYKNFVPFIEECVPLLNENKELHIVCTGMPFSEQEQKLFRLHGIECQVVHKYASSTELVNIYHHALAFIYPSSYEGFGIPILEAFACDCPAFLNHASCFPEIAQNAASYFEINKTRRTLTKVLEDYLNNIDNVRPKLIQEGKKRLADFSWNKSAQQLVDVYNLIL